MFKLVLYNSHLATISFIALMQNLKHLCNSFRYLLLTVKQPISKLTKKGFQYNKKYLFKKIC